MASAAAVLSFLGIAAVSPPGRFSSSIGQPGLSFLPFGGAGRMEGKENHGRALTGEPTTVFLFNLQARQLFQTLVFLWKLLPVKALVSSFFS